VSIESEPRAGAVAKTQGSASAQLVALKKKLAETTTLALKYKQAATKLKESSDQKSKHLLLAQRQALALKQQLEAESANVATKSGTISELESQLQDFRNLVDTQENVVSRQLLELETTNFQLQQQTQQST
jgi:hypothetical protein